MEEDRIWILFGRRVSGEITPEELKELRALMDKRPDEGYSMEIIFTFLESDRKADEQDAAEMAKKLWPRLEAAMHAQERTHSKPPLPNPAKTLRSE
jgi:transmembrane sensor